MAEIKDPILAAMEFSLNYTLKRFEDTETEDGKIIREGIIRGKTLVEHLRIFGADVYGKSKEQFTEDIKDKTNIVMMTDEEYKEYICVRFERPNNNNGFDFAEIIMPDKKFIKAFGFSEDELYWIESFAADNLLLMWEMAKESKQIA